jgi:hypothetical protein
MKILTGSGCFAYTYTHTHTLTLHTYAPTGSWSKQSIGGIGALANNPHGGEAQDLVFQVFFQARPWEGTESQWHLRLLLSMQALSIQAQHVQAAHNMFAKKRMSAIERPLKRPL